MKLPNPQQLDQTLLHSGLGQLGIRVIVGVVMMYHGAQKLFGWFGGGGIEDSAAFFESIGIPFATLNVYLAGGTELLAGGALILGLAVRPAALALAFTMFVAAFTAHSGAFGLMHNGMEYALTLAIVSLGLVALGAGRWSIDRVVAGLLSARRAAAHPPAAALA